MTLLLVGGDPRDDTRQAIERQLRCRLIWPKSPRGRSRFLAPHFRRGVDIALIMLRCTSHCHSAELYDLCRRNGVPCVKLKGGYSPRRVEYEIKQQVRNGI